MNKDLIYLSTTASDAGDVARKYCLGIEIAEFCTPWNLDDSFVETDETVRKAVDGVDRRVFHAPFSELFPCAIDPKARELAAFRYRQAIRIAKAYGAEKVIIHGGYNPWLYYPIWYTEQSVVFWKEFLQEDPGVQLVLENVLETEPELLLEILDRVNDPRLGMCLDIGHANAYSKVSLTDWVDRCAKHIRHVHIHNNGGTKDAHQPLFDGTIPMKELLDHIQTACPGATMTMELYEAEPSVRWLLEE